MRAALLAWFSANRRDLPWRRPDHRRDPYRVLVAEVMLQQTQVATATPYYHRWLRRFPDMRTLAEADQDAVLRAWQGLGYYRRALNLWRTARAVMQSGGALPTQRAELERLPGVGRYTAAAVAALAFGLGGVAVDGNVRRLGARLLGWDTPPPDREVERALLASFGEPPPAEAAAFAEALIELGALLCTPRAPACPRCPLEGGCAAARQGAPERYPRARPRRRPPRRRRYALVAVEGGQVWLRRREAGALLGGMWGFPQSDEAPDGGSLLPAVHHAYSHFRLELVPALVSSAHPALSTASGVQPQPLDALRDLPLSAVDVALLAQLSERGVLGPAAPTAPGAT